MPVTVEKPASRPSLAIEDIPIREIELHGHKVTYREVGDGPVLLLLHGVTGDLHTWNEVLPKLAENYTVITPDMLGHGESAKPRGDYSLGSYASGVRDLLGALGHFRATVVGHSLGGGIAMQMAYQFPERCERLVLVCSGGLGNGVSPLLRASTLPLSEFVLPLLAHDRVIGLGRSVGDLLGKVGLRPGSDIREAARGYASLSRRDASNAFIHTMRSVIDLNGQRVSALDRLYLTRTMPSLLVWGGRDRIIPPHHGERAHEEMPGSRYELFATSGHFPHLSEPGRFARVMHDFIATTEPAEVSDESIRQVLLDGR